jgi:hypothetical protein
MEQSNVGKIIRVDEDGTKQECHHCVVISCEDDDFKLDFVDMAPLDMVRSAIGLVEALKQLGLGEMLQRMTEYFADKPLEVAVKESDEDAGLQADD